MTAIQLKTYAEIAEIGFKIAAMIVIGVWAIYGLIVFRQRQAAITALRKAESEAAGLELAAKRRAVLDIVINHECRKDENTTGYVLNVQIVISNAGVAAAHMKFEPGQAPIRIRRAQFDAAGVMSLPADALPLPVLNINDPTKHAIARVVRAGGTSRLSSAIKVSEPGVYAITFRVPMDEVNTQAMIEVGADPQRKQYWSATSFACVGLPPAILAPNAQTIT